MNLKDQFKTFFIVRKDGNVYIVINLYAKSRTYQINTYYGLILSTDLIKSMASSEISSNSSSGKVRLHLEMLRNVSCLLSPPKGE